MELSDHSQQPAISSGSRFPQNFRLLPETGALLGVVVALFVASSGRGFWNTLHAAFTDYMQRVGTIAGLAVPIGAGAGFLLMRALQRKNIRQGIAPDRWPRLLLTIWLSVAPALHWFAALFLFLFASRYTPDGGKTTPIIFGVLHALLLVLSVSANACVFRKLRRADTVSLVYFALLTVALALPGETPAGFLHLMPFMFWAQKPVFMPVALVLYVGLSVSAVVVAKQHARSRGQEALSRSSDPKQMVVAESIGFSLAALSLLAYFITSQFDSRPTTPITHGLLLVQAASFMIGAFTFERRQDVARKFLRAIAPGLVIVELAAMVALHHRDETDPIMLMMVAMGMIVILAPVAAVVPFRRPVEGA